MAEGEIPAFPKFDSNADNVGLTWNKWHNRLENLLIAMNITNNKRKKAMMLHLAGEEVNDIFETLTVADPGEGENEYDLAVGALTEYFVPNQNSEFQVFIFRQTHQEKDENIMAYYSRLKQLSNSCGFADANKEIKSQIISGCRSHRLRLKALSEQAWDLPKILQVARAAELSETHAATMEKAAPQSANFVKKGPKFNGNKSAGNSEKPKPTEDKKCHNCGNKWPHKGGQRSCPAFGVECRKCKRKNHFADVCLNVRKDNNNKPYNNNKPAGRRVHAVSQEEIEVRDSDNDGYVFTVRSDQDKQAMFKVKLNGFNAEVMADSGSSVNIMANELFQKLPSKPTLQKVATRVYSYGGNTVPLVGKCTAEVETRRKIQPVEFLVADTKGVTLLSWKTSQDLEMIAKVYQVDDREEIIKKLKSEYQDIFKGLGKLKDFQVKLHIDESVQPVAQNYCRIPFHVRKDLESQIEKNESLGVIQKVSGATPWVSPVVIVPKKQPGKVRVCVDMRMANQAIKRERHSTPTLTEMMSDLNGSRVFSKVDLNQGYNQLELHPESRYITTFTTHVGLRQYSRLSFGISSAAEIFQNAIREALSGLRGVINVSDDILIFGNSQEEHDSNLKELFNRIREKGLTLNEAKCEFNKDKLEFFGHVFSEKGVEPDAKKIQSILDMPDPQNASEVRSLLGMTNYCGSRFIAAYSTLTHELHELTKKDTPFIWTEKHSNALKKLKLMLTQSPVLDYFDSTKINEVYVDASPVGLSAILMQRSIKSQDRTIVTYASRALTPVEARYSQTEREALAVVWGMEHLNIYLYGHPVEVYTDHKPLLGIFGNPSSKTSARLERWSLRLQPYDIKLHYRAGHDNPADYLSRHPLKATETGRREEKVAEEYVQYVSVNAVPKAMTIEELKNATQGDLTLQAIVEAVRTGQWHEIKNRAGVNENAIAACAKFKEEFTYLGDGDMVLRGHRLVIPESLQQRVITLAHEGHLGVVKTKGLLREKVWFYGIDKRTEDLVKDCLACQAATPVVTREPLQMSELPSQAWSTMSADFGEIRAGEYILVLTDEFSRFPLVEIISLTSAKE